jgi:hypothetical protein
MFSSVETIRAQADIDASKLRGPKIHQGVIHPPGSTIYGKLATSSQPTNILSMMIIFYHDGRHSYIALMRLALDRASDLIPLSS